MDYKIRYVFEDAPLDRLLSKYGALDKASEELAKDFRAINVEASKAGASLQTAGVKGANGVKNISKEAKQAKNDLSQLDQSAKLVGGAIATYFSFQALKSLATDIVRATAEYQKFQAVLTNTLGSRELADATLGVLQDFAKKTPFQLNEITGAYVKLANQGFKPTAAQLTKLGDLASSTGKSFDMLAEAVIDAQTGEFERLKEFGIRASKQGDQVAFTFKGVTTTVKATNESIREYITSLGAAEGVSGAMAAQSATLGGAISNLDDAWDQLLVSIGQKFGTVLTKAFTDLGTFVNNIKDLLATVDDDVKKLSADGILKITQQRDDFVKAEITRLQKLGKTQEEITKAVNESLLAENLKAFNNQDALRRHEEKQRIELAQRLEDLSKKTAGQIGGIGSFDLVSATSTIEGFKKALDDLENTDNLSENLKNNIEAYKKTLSGLDVVAFKINDTFERTAKTQDQVAEAFNKASIEAGKLAKANDDLLKKELERLGKEEELAIRQAKVTIDDSEEEGREVLRIQSVYGQKKSTLIADFGKRNTAIYREAAIRQNEIFISQAEYELDLEKKKQDALIKVREDRVKENLGAIDDIGERQKLSNDRLTRDAIEAEQNKYMTSRDIKNRAVEYELKVNEIVYQSTRKNILNEIDLLGQKLEIENLGPEQRLKIEQELEQKKSALLDLDFKKFEETEDKKTKKAKEAADQRAKIAEEALNVGIELANVAFEISNNRIQGELDALNFKAEEDKRLAGDNAKTKEQIAIESARKENQLKRKQAENDRNQAIFNIGISTAQAVVKALASGPPPLNYVLAAIVGAAGAAQLAVVLSKPLPKFAKGTKNVTGGETGKDSVHALLMPGEAVIPTDANKKYGPIVSDMVENKLSLNGLRHKYSIPESASKSSDFATVSELRALRKDIKNIKNPVIEMDKHGFKTYIVSATQKQQFLNNYFNA